MYFNSDINLRPILYFQENLFLRYPHTAPPRNIYGTAEDTNFIFGAQIDDNESYQQFAKLSQMGTWPRSRDHFLHFGPLYIYAMAEAANLKFGTQIDNKEYCPKSAKLGEMVYDTRSLCLQDFEVGNAFSYKLDVIKN